MATSGKAKEGQQSYSGRWKLLYYSRMRRTPMISDLDLMNRRSNLEFILRSSKSRSRGL
jgi:hypothetical protein